MASISNVESPVFIPPPTKTVEAELVTNNAYVAIFVANPVLEGKTTAPCSDHHVSQKVSRKERK